VRFLEKICELYWLRYRILFVTLCILGSVSMELCPFIVHDGKEKPVLGPRECATSLRHGSAALRSVDEVKPVGQQLRFSRMCARWDCV
jgi:hypothetical protein